MQTYKRVGYLFILLLMLCLQHVERTEQRCNYCTNVLTLRGNVRTEVRDSSQGVISTSLYLHGINTESEVCCIFFSCFKVSVLMMLFIPATKPETKS